MNNLERRKYFKKIGIYRIFSSVNNKSYIGSSSNLYSRINKHINDLNKNEHHSIYLQRHYNKHGNEDLNIEIVCFCEITDLFKLELDNIIKYNSFNNGFNCLEIPGYSIGYKFTKEQLKNLKSIQKINAIKYRDSLLKRLEKARLSLINNPIKIDWWVGRKHKNSSKIKMSISAKNRGPLNEKKVTQRDINNNFIETYKSAKEAERITGIKATNIGKCCLGERKSAGKYKWSFTL